MWTQRAEVRPQLLRRRLVLRLVERPVERAAAAGDVDEEGLEEGHPRELRVEREAARMGLGPREQVGARLPRLGRARGVVDERHLHVAPRRLHAADRLLEVGGDERALRVDVAGVGEAVGEGAVERADLAKLVERLAVDPHQVVAARRALGLALAHDGRHDLVALPGGDAHGDAEAVARDRHDVILHVAVDERVAVPHHPVHRLPARLGEHVRPRSGGEAGAVGGHVGGGVGAPTAAPGENATDGECGGRKRAADQGTKHDGTRGRKSGTYGVGGGPESNGEEGHHYVSDVLASPTTAPVTAEGRARASSGRRAPSSARGRGGTVQNPTRRPNWNCRGAPAFFFTMPALSGPT